MDVPVNYMDIPIEPIIPPQIEVDPSLRTIRQPVGDPRDAFDVPVPEVRATTHSQHDNFDKSAVTHVVIQ